MAWYRKHKHKWKFVGKTYAPPTMTVIPNDLLGLSTETREAIERSSNGWTTYLWECEDIECDALRKEKCLGKVVF